MRTKHFCAALGLKTLSASAIAITSTLCLSAAPSLALTFSWNLNKSVGNYQAQGAIFTNTNTPNQNLLPSNITDWSIQLLNNGVPQYQLTPSTSNLNYGYGVQIDNTGNSLVLQQGVNQFYSLAFTSPDNSNRFYFGAPNSDGAPFASITIGGASSGTLPTSSILATGGTPVPWEFSPGTGIVIGGSLLIGARMLKKTIALKRSKVLLDGRIS